MLVFAASDCFDPNFGGKKAEMEFFLGRSLDIEVGVIGEGANDDGVSIVVAAESGVSSELDDSCRSFLSKE